MINLAYNGMFWSMPAHILGWYIIFGTGKVYLIHSDYKLSDNLAITIEIVGTGDFP